jgi:DNA mismatch repair protein MutS
MSATKASDGPQAAPDWLTYADADVEAQTPVMREVLRFKAAHPEALLFFRLGDFYELFFDDAVEGAALLDLVLTSRNKNEPRPIPMCGFPHHQRHAYTQRLLALGRRVAICEQLEDASKARGMVKRGVTHVVTPGVVLEEEALDAGCDNHLLAVVAGRDGLGVAVAEVSTGRLESTHVAHELGLETVLARFEPREVVAPRATAETVLAGLPALSGVLVTCREPPTGRPTAGPARATASEQGAIGLLQMYLAEVRPSTLALLEAPRALALDAHLRLDREAVVHLEVVRTAREGRVRGSLLHAVDRTVTAAGTRRLRGLLLAPLADRDVLLRRHGAVDALVGARVERGELRALLTSTCDLARAAGRAVAGMSTPRELAAVRGTLQALPDLARILTKLAGSSPALGELGARLQGHDALSARLTEALADEPRGQVRDGGVIRPGFDPDLDELVSLVEDGATWLARYEQEAREVSGIEKLRIRHNRVSGYALEVARSRAADVPADWHRKQTLKNVERYTTEALSDFEARVDRAHAERLERETALFDALVGDVAAHASALRGAAGALADLDVHRGYAELAEERGYVRPAWTEAIRVELKDARHPVVEQLVAQGRFVPNDIELSADERQILLLTGPNMAGKSTLMRTLATSQILAQAGGFVPASAATMPVLDAVMTRIGASDDIAEGASTFMVEMRETARILRDATERTLVLLDEVGRGTSTDDGLSIAWAVVERLHDEAGAMTLFATHYHELTALEDALERLHNVHVAVREHDGEIVFVHQLQPGPSSRSHGIAVARLAGLPEAVIERAGVVLDGLGARRSEDTERARARPGRDGEPPAAAAQQLTFFDAPAAPRVDPQLVALRDAIAQLDPDALSPRAALDALYALRARAVELDAGGGATPKD